MESINIILIIFMLICAFTAARVRELVSGVFLLGAFSFFLAVLWSYLSAPDVSFTEAMVGSGASTVFLLLALFGSSHHCKTREKQPLLLPTFIIMLGFAGLIFWGSSDLPTLGNLNSAASQYLSPFYLENAYTHSKTPNAVTAVVIDYRGFDTLIESTVIFTAGVACLLIMKPKEGL